MKKIFFIFRLTIITIFFITSIQGAESNFFAEGKKLFLKKDLEGSKFLFEKDIVFNPKNEISYLYLAKIFHSKENEEDEEFNLNTVLLLNPKNEEALYLLTKLKIRQSNFSEAEDLIAKFEIACVSLCSKKTEIKKKLKNYLDIN